LRLVSFDKRGLGAISSERETVFVIRTGNEWNDERLYGCEELDSELVLNSLVG
jgi:hypothetical protein